MYKQGHSVKTWKDRVVEINPGVLHYYTPKGEYKGEVKLEGGKVQPVEPANCKAPNDSFPFVLLLYDSYLNCYTFDKNIRCQLSELIEAFIRLYQIPSLLLNVPKLKAGWLDLRGNTFKSWKRRYFILKYGKIFYYNREVWTGDVTELGSMQLIGTYVKVVPPNNSKKTTYRFAISNEKTNKDLLLLEAADRPERERWFDSLKRHIEYAHTIHSEDKDDDKK